MSSYINRVSIRKLVKTKVTCQVLVETKSNREALCIRIRTND